MTRGSDLPLQIRAAIVVYRFDLHLQYKQIAAKLNIEEEAVKSLCQRVKKRSTGYNLLDYLQAIGNQERSGRPQRAEPGDAVSLAVRRGAQKHDTQQPEEAANQEIKGRQALGDISHNVRRVPKRQVYHILEDSDHCAEDPIEKRPLVRRRYVNKTELTNDHKQLRLQYCDEIDYYYRQNALIITVDEKQFTFGGTAGSKVTRPQGTTSYEDVATKQFSLEQWAAACAGDLSIIRPHCVWSAETQNLQELRDQLDIANQQNQEAVL